MKRFLTWASGPVLALFFLWLTFRGADLAALGDSLAKTSIGLIALCYLSGPIHLMFRSWRWGTLLAPARARDQLPFSERLSAVSIGSMATLLPGRVGEVLRPALLTRRTGIPFGTTVATVGVERLVLDFGTVLAFGSIGLLLPSRLTGIGEASNPEVLALVRATGGVLLAGTAIAAVAVVVVAWRRDEVSSWFETRAARTDRRLAASIYRSLASIPLGLASMKSGRGLVRLAFESLVVWGVITAGVYCGIVASGVPIQPLATLVMLPILAIGIGIPTPAGTGSFHFAMKLGLADLLGFDAEAALSAGIAVHAMNVLAMLTMGSIFLAWGGLTRPNGAGGIAGEAHG